MRSFITGVLAVALLSTNGVYGQNTTGSAAQAGTYSANNFAWGIGAGALVAIGVVVGITAAAASSNNSNAPSTSASH